MNIRRSLGGLDGHSHENRGICARPLRTRGGLNVEKEVPIYTYFVPAFRRVAIGIQHIKYIVDRDRSLPTSYMYMCLRLSMPLETELAVFN